MIDYCFFSACGFFDLRLCAFRVCTDNFVSLYVSEFLTAACGVSPLRGRPALAKAQGLDPNAFSFGCGSVGVVHLNIKSKIPMCAPQWICFVFVFVLIIKL